MFHVEQRENCIAKKLKRPGNRGVLTSGYQVRGLTVPQFWPNQTALVSMLPFCC